MPDSVNVRIEDDEGNKYYVQTTAENVLLEDGTTLEQKLKEIPREIIDSVAIISSSSGEEIEITDSAEAPLMGLNLYATCKQDKYQGRNLFNKNAITQNKYLELNDEGEVELKTLSGYWTSDFIPIKPNTRYTKSRAYWSGNFYYDANKEYISNDLGSEVISTPEGAAYTRFSASPYASKNTFMFNEGSELLPYEPYTGGIPSPNGDYPQEIQAISDFVVEVKNSMGEVAAPQTLNVTIPEQRFYGIPVSSGGNYTDSSGQRWICDEFDFKNKKFIQRIERISLDGSEDERWGKGITSVGLTRFYITLADGGMGLAECLCNRLIRRVANEVGSCFISDRVFFIYLEQSIDTVELLREYLKTHPLDVIYPLETPIEIDISDEEIQAFKELHTYKPNTTIMSDSEPQAGMKVEYALDMKTYVDNKFLELATQVLENA